MFHIPLPAHLSRSAPKHDAEVDPEEEGAPQHSTSHASSVQYDIVNEEEKMKYFHKVPVTADVSVMSLAVRFDVSEHEIRQHNPQLLFNYCDFHEYVWIPKTGQEEPADASYKYKNKDATKLYFAKKEFMLKTQCTEEEAAYYLSANDNDPKKAIANWTDDNEWERKQREAKAKANAPANAPANTPANVPAAPANAAPTSAQVNMMLKQKAVAGSTHAYASLPQDEPPPAWHPATTDASDTSSASATAASVYPSLPPVNPAYAAYTAGAGQRDVYATAPPSAPPAF